MRQVPTKDSAIDANDVDYTEFFRLAAVRIKDTDYAEQRGLSPEVVQLFRLGFVKEWRNPTLDEEKHQRISPSPRLIIPTSSYSYVARDTRQELTDKQRCYAKLKVGHVHIFNAEALEQGARSVFVTEGEIDALSIESVGGCACALGSTGMVNAFLKEVERHRPKRPLIITLDRDAAGCMAKDKLITGLEALGITYQSD